MIHAAIHHTWFERIHSSVDGNGRVGNLPLFRPTSPRGANRPRD
ncbi:MAG: Fic family protein [Candidatus Rokubacteria bacterium]|nr:Fic family protein [Candidatus Rokubacteria bacterium]